MLAETERPGKQCVSLSHCTAFDVWLDDHRDIWSELVLKLLVWSTGKSKAFWQTRTSKNIATFSKSFWVATGRLLSDWHCPDVFQPALPTERPSFWGKGGRCCKNHKGLPSFKRKRQILKHWKSERVDLFKEMGHFLLLCLEFQSLCQSPIFFKKIHLKYIFDT